MGTVVKLHPDHCDCGWPVPKNVTVTVVDTSIMPQVGEILYDCPQCGMPRMVCLRARPDLEPVG